MYNQSTNIVIVPPHLGGVAVVGALNGELSATAVNAPMGPAEVLSELSPYVVLAEKLGRLAVQPVGGGSGIKSVKVVYKSTRDPNDVDTRLLRAMITKGIVEPISNVFANLVNADFTAEERIPFDGSHVEPLDSIEVLIAGVESKFASALSDSGGIRVKGKVEPTEITIVIESVREQLAEKAVKRRGD
ncbi:D-3-phosphoglycerate dehydrogenase 1, chloroplastic [Asimina triloba]